MLLLGIASDARRIHNHQEIPSGSSAIEPADLCTQTTQIPEGILTPDVVETSIGTLEFFDGAPLPETAELVYDNLDRMRGVDAFLKCMPAASVRQLMLGAGMPLGASDISSGSDL
jgi:hypothetical protein